MSCGCGGGRTTLPPIIVNVPGLQGPAVDVSVLQEGLVKFTEKQELSDAQKEIARKNIGAADDEVPDLETIYLIARD